MIDEAELSTNFIALSLDAPLGGLLEQLHARDLDEWRGGLVVLIDADGTCRSATIDDLARLAANSHRLSAGAPLADLDVFADTPIVDRRDGEIRDVLRLATRSRAHRVVVVEGVDPVGYVQVVALDVVSRTVDPQVLLDLDMHGEEMEGEAPEETPLEVHRPPERRSLSAQVYSVSGPDGERVMRRRESFQAGGWHDLVVWVGPEEQAEGVLRADRDFPEAELPAGPETYPLAVALDLPDGQTHFDAITLPARQGRSSTCTFRFEVPDGDQFEADLHLLYQLRLIQTVRIRGPIVPSLPDVADGRGPIELRALVPMTTDPARRVSYQAAIWMHHERVQITDGETTRDVALNDIRAEVEAIGELVRRGAREVARAANDQQREQRFLDLVRRLAKRGRLIYDAIELPEGQLARAARIHTFSKGDADLLPIEIVYDRMFPADDARLCTTWVAALEAARMAGGVDGSEQISCTCDAHDNAKVICPIGFWGLRKSIERKANTEPPAPGEPERAAPNRSEPTPSLDRLATVEAVAYAAADLVDEVEGGHIEGLRAHLGDLAGKAVDRSDTWTAWRSTVVGTRPGLLVALTHTTKSPDGIEALQMGEGEADQLLEVGALQQNDVQQPIADPGPIVLLLGCETATPDIGFHSFVGRFLDAHAAVVIATLANILGRQSAPAAELMVGRIGDAQGSAQGVSVGEFVRSARGELVALRNPVGLALVAFGDADWRLAAAAS